MERYLVDWCKSYLQTCRNGCDAWVTRVSKIKTEPFSEYNSGGGVRLFSNVIRVVLVRVACYLTGNLVWRTRLAGRMHSELLSEERIIRCHHFPSQLLAILEVHD